jgi:hypothetical protein
MNIILSFLLLIFTGCAGTEIRPEWDLPSERTYSGHFKNTGQEASGRAVYLRKLTGFFWPGSLLEADRVRLSQEFHHVQVEALKDGQVIRSEAYNLANGSLVIKRNEAKGGAFFETVDTFTRIRTGLVVKRREAGIAAIFPFIGQETYWLFYPLVEE